MGLQNVHPENTYLAVLFALDSEYDNKNWEQVNKAFEFFYQKMHPDNRYNAAYQALKSEYEGKNWDQVNKNFEIFYQKCPDNRLQAAQQALESQHDEQKKCLICETKHYSSKSE